MESLAEAFSHTSVQEEVTPLPPDKVTAFVIAELKWPEDFLHAMIALYREGDEKNMETLMHCDAKRIVHRMRSWVLVRRYWKYPDCELPATPNTCTSQDMQSVWTPYFLGHCKLSDVRETDLASLKELGVSCSDIAAKVKLLVEVMKQAIARGQGYRRDARAYKTTNCMAQALHKSTVDHPWEGSDFLRLLPEIGEVWSLWLQEECTLNELQYRVSRVTWGGAQQCPFQSPSDKCYYGYEYGGKDFVIEDLVTKRSVAISSLTLHMIENHNFFQRPGSLYRLEPRVLVDVLFRKDKRQQRCIK